MFYFASSSGFYESPRVNSRLLFLVPGRDALSNPTWWNLQQGLERYCSRAHNTKSCNSRDLGRSCNSVFPWQTPRKWLDFQSQPLNLEALKNLVDGIPRERGVVALDKVLEEARKLFEGSRSRARKVGKIYIPTLRDLISCSDCFNFKFLGAQANWWHPCRKWPMSRFES